MSTINKTQEVPEIYLHIPKKERIKSDFHSKTLPFFLPHAGCPYRCSFCDQKSISSHNKMPKVDEVGKNIEEYVSRLSKDEKIQIGFFGGSFTGLSHDVQIAYLQEAIKYKEHLLGIRISTRPDMLDEKTLELLQKYHVKTVELGAQSLNNDVLRKNLRGHLAEDVAKGVRLLKKYGFRVGIQTLPGLPLDTYDNAMKTAQEIIKLEPDEVRIYPAVVLADTKLAEWYLDGSFTPLSIDAAVMWCMNLEMQYQNAAIPVIKMGLHASDTFTGDAGILAGPYHPAFRDLVEDAVMLKEIRVILDLFFTSNFDENRHIKIHVSNDIWNHVIGHKKENLKRLQTLYPDITLELIKEV